MPNDLVGKIGIRIRYALKGLTGLMGIQVDPYYGQQRAGERLYIRVANLGNEAIKLLPGAAVFTFEVHQLAEAIDCSRFPQDPTWEVLKSGLSDQVDASWSYATRINDDSVERGRQLKEEADDRECGRGQGRNWSLPEILQQRAPSPNPRLQNSGPGVRGRKEPGTPV